MNIVFTVILIELLIVAWIDFRDKKISNLWALFNIAVSLSFHLLLRESFPLSWEILIFPLGWLMIGFLLFLMKIMGAGDSKFLASLFLLIPLEYHVVFFTKLVSSTILVGLILLMMKVVKDIKRIKAYALTSYWSGIKDMVRSRFSYAPVILLAWILFGVSLWV